MKQYKLLVDYEYGYREIYGLLKLKENVTDEQAQEVIDKVRSEKPTDYTLDDILNRLKENDMLINFSDISMLEL